MRAEPLLLQEDLGEAAGKHPGQEPREGAAAESERPFFQQLSELPIAPFGEQIHRAGHPAPGQRPQGFPAEVQGCGARDAVSGEQELAAGLRHGASFRFRPQGGLHPDAVQHLHPGFLDPERHEGGSSGDAGMSEALRQRRPGAGAPELGIRRPPAAEDHAPRPQVAPGLQAQQETLPVLLHCGDARVQADVRAQLVERRLEHVHDRPGASAAREHPPIRLRHEHEAQAFEIRARPGRVEAGQRFPDEIPDSSAAVIALGTDVAVGEVAAPAAAGQDLAPEGLAALQERDRGPGPRGLQGRDQARGPSPDDGDARFHGMDDTRFPARRASIGMMPAP